MRKFRQCPHCKSKKGFSYDYSVNGYGSEKCDFNGNVIDSDRNVFDSVDHYSARCLNCDKPLDLNRLEI